MIWKSNPWWAMPQQGNPPLDASADRASDRLHARWPHGLQMKLDVGERLRDLLHGRHEVGGVREGVAQVLDRCFSLRIHVLLLVLSSEYVLLGVSNGAKLLAGRRHVNVAEITNEAGEVLARGKGLFIVVDPAKMFARFIANNAVTKKQAPGRTKALNQ